MNSCLGWRKRCLFHWHSICLSALLGLRCCGHPVALRLVSCQVPLPRESVGFDGCVFNLRNSWLEPVIIAYEVKKPITLLISHATYCQFVTWKSSTFKMSKLSKIAAGAGFEASFSRSFWLKHHELFLYFLGSEMFCTVYWPFFFTFKNSLFNIHVQWFFLHKRYCSKNDPSSRASVPLY